MFTITTALFGAYVRLVINTTKKVVELKSEWLDSEYAGRFSEYLIDTYGVLESKIIKPA